MYSPPMDRDDTPKAKGGVGCSSDSAITRVTHGNTVPRTPNKADGYIGAAYTSDRDLMGLWHEIQHERCQLVALCGLMQQYAIGRCVLDSQQLSVLLEENITQLLALGVLLGIVEIEEYPADYMEAG